MDVRSYRRVFDLERRIYRIDRVRLNPSGIPVRGVVYLLALMLAAVIVARLPGVRLLASALPWYVRDVALPGSLAAALGIVRVDGRPFHVAARTLMRAAARPRTLVALHARRRCWQARWTPPPLVLIPDGSDARLRRFRYTGPGAVRVSAAHERRDGPRALVALRLSAHLNVRASVRAGSGARRDGAPVGVAASFDSVVVLDRGARASTR